MFTLLQMAATTAAPTRSEAIAMPPAQDIVFNKEKLILLGHSLKVAAEIRALPKNRTQFYKKLHTIYVDTEPGYFIA